MIRELEIFYVPKQMDPGPCSVFPLEGPSVSFGHIDDCIRAIGKYQAVCLVEDYFDLLACPLLYPGAPILSTETQSVNQLHI
jgi:hypothetical protein